jgi:hypothetical protein
MHTPGPWRDYGHTGYVYGPDVVVCRCGDYSDKELLPFNKDRWAADARLIAAAPDLLAALQAMLKRYGIHSNGDIKIAADAVAKATGSIRTAVKQG